MPQTIVENKVEKNFIDVDKLKELASLTKPTPEEISQILQKAKKLQGLSLQDVSKLLQIEEPDDIQRILETAGEVKQKIYGRRIVLFAPLYTGNVCSNNCLYCGFRKDNISLARRILNMEEIKQEVESLLKQGHKRLLMLCGESQENSIDYIIEAIRTAYSVKINNSQIRRINIEIAPMEVSEFAKLKGAKIGTYACFQETYEPELYKKYHPIGPKADYLYRLTVMDRAMQGGIDDVGIGVLFGLADYRFEVLAMLEHAHHLEEVFGCGPHTISVPRIEPAENTPLSKNIPFPVSDENFKKIVAILRIALPYTGIILSTRESETLRNELFRYGISQISAGSRTNPGAYNQCGAEKSGAQFSLGDHRSLEEVICRLIDMEYIPSFCTGCYRKGRVGKDFMDLAKPGLIQKYCMPNAIFTFAEYLEDFASVTTKERGYQLIHKCLTEVKENGLQHRMQESIEKIVNKERDIYF